ncbi:kynureninase [Nocardiopsis changdeensis]|uniref:Kynureninase n=1 Tax=Nocardiopsis changdeensis TaxID=2831969 RepID=A0ABX8BJ65_9ACTN|nr:MULTISPECIES: kynureninase [Nocardiopsis]QUX21359.1 kynureninase [Nocardiopsis changdeensis]QYX37290.1 kynureninase [Nocardiopsis sp. MT53]
MTPTTRQECAALDAADPLAPLRDEFVLPAGVIYLDGNSLGALPRSTPGRVADMIEREWGQDLIRSWNDAGWWDKPRTLGAKVAPLVGADPDEVIVGDGTSANLFKCVIAALRMSDRSVVLGEAGNFPTDLYVAEGAVSLAGAVQRRVDPDGPDLERELAAGDVAVLLLSHVDYRTGTLRDMPGITRLAHEHGALVIWDLCHSVGAVPVELSASGADFAVGCTYKYLNAGPGAPAFLYAARRHHAAADQPLSGWHGHARPFDFTGDYEPAPGVSRFLSGSQPLVADAALEASLDVWARADLALVRAKSLAMTDLFLARAAEAGISSVTPAEHARRGSQVALVEPEEGAGYPIVQALIARGVIGDFRAPDVMRFGFTPLYLRYTDVWDATEALHEVVRTGEWREERFARRGQVT